MLRVTLGIFRPVFVCQFLLRCLYHILLGQSICDLACGCLERDHLRLGRPCAAIKHTDSVGLTSDVKPASTEPFQLLLGLSSTRATLPIWA